MAEAKKVETIDIGPITWAAHLPILLAIHAEGDAEGRAVALTELKKMARAADKAVGMLATLKAIAERPWAEADQGEADLANELNKIIETARDAVGLVRS